MPVDCRLPRPKRIHHDVGRINAIAITGNLRCVYLDGGAERLMKAVLDIHMHHPAINLRNFAENDHAENMGG